MQGRGKEKAKTEGEVKPGGVYESRKKINWNRVDLFLSPSLSQKKQVNY